MQLKTIEEVHSLVQQYFPNLEMDLVESTLKICNRDIYIEYRSKEILGVYLYFEKTSSPDEPVLGGLMFAKDGFTVGAIAFFSVKDIEALMQETQKSWQALNSSFSSPNRE